MDLGLTGVQYNVALSILFVTYIICGKCQISSPEPAWRLLVDTVLTFCETEIPSNMLLKKFKKPSHYMSMLVTCWGIVMTMTGVVQNYAGLVVCRLLLGLFE